MHRLMRIASRTALAVCLAAVAGCANEYRQWTHGISDCPGPDCRARTSTWGDYGTWTAGDPCGCRPAACARPCNPCAQRAPCARPCPSPNPCQSPCVPAPGVRYVPGAPPPPMAVRPVPAPTPGPARTPAPAPATRTLFERIGGMPAVEAFVDDFLARLVANPVLTANPKVKEFVEKGAGEGANRRDATTLRKHLIEQVCQAAGGPCVYTGRDMKTAHTGLGITEAEWNAGASDLVATLDKLGVVGREREEIVAFVVAQKADIVEKP